MNRTGPSSGAELLRSQGLVADGPVLWDRPVAARGPGVYIVQLPEPTPAMPADHAALRAWIERVPTLTVDGERPTPVELAARLQDFWLPTESVLYIGRTTSSLRARLAAFYRTPLGDPRPHAGGHWLKTLALLRKLIVWWAETDAPVEYEDALLDAFAKRIDPDARAALHDPDTVLPFANLQTGTGARKRHGIAGSVLPVTDGPSPTAGTAPVGSAGSKRPSRARRSPSASRPVRRPRDAAPRPVTPPTELSAAAIEQFRAELAERSDSQRLAIAGRIRAARELGDLRENADYEAARREQSFNEGRIQALEALLRDAVVLDQSAGDGTGVIRLGSTVVLETADGERITYALVGPAETDPAAGRVSYLSPIGAALLGRRATDEVTVRAPSGDVRYRVDEVR